MEVKTITQGRDGCKVNGAYKLIFPIRKDYYHIRNDGTETAYASVFSDSTDTAEDGVYDIPSGGTLCIRSHGYDTLYVSGKVTVMGTDSAIPPFKSAQRGGDGTQPDYLIQYGMVSSGTDSVDITFPHAYPDIPVVTAVARGSTAAAVAVDNVSQTGFTAVGGNMNWTAVAMIPQVTIIQQPKDVTAAIGDKVSFTVSAEGEGLTYQWQCSSNNGQSWYNSTYPGYATNTMTMTATEARCGLVYRCRITDSNGASILSNVVTLKEA